MNFYHIIGYEKVVKVEEEGRGEKLDKKKQLIISYTLENVQTKYEW